MGCFMEPPMKSQYEESKSFSPKLITASDSPALIDISKIWKVFELKKRLGKGASGEVMLVSRRDTNDQYALKVMSRKSSRRSFWTEYDMLRRLRYPHIIKYVGAYRSSLNFYLCLEYCSGDSLFKRLGRRKKYTEETASSTVKTMLETLKYLSDRNIIHRDIKPENFVFSSESDSGLKLLDFGIALEVEPERSYRFRVGTPYYMSPEVVRNIVPRSGAICKKSDLWSLGVCVFTMLNGKVPFMGAKKSEIFHSIITQDVTFKVEGISYNGVDFVLKLLDRNLDSRFTVDEALAHPWIMNCEENTNEIVFSTIQGLRKISTKQSLQKALHNATDTDDTHIRTLFNQMDFDVNGEMRREDTTKAVKLCLAHGDTEKCVDNIMSRRSGRSFSYAEFKDSVINHLHSKEYKLHVIFCILDEDQDGSISIDEFIGCLLGPKAKDHAVQDIVRAFKEVDKNNDGRLSFNEFVKLLSKRESWTKCAFEVLQRQEVDEVINDNGRYG